MKHESEKRGIEPCHMRFRLWSDTSEMNTRKARWPALHSA